MLYSQPLACFLLPLLALTAGLSAQTLPQPPATTTAPTTSTAPALHWKILPPEILSIHPGPDGRLWQTLPITPSTQPATQLSLPTIQSEILAQFAQKSPTLRYSFPILFEKNGRVWFASISPFPTPILAYDGKTWIIRDPAATTPPLPYAQHFQGYSTSQPLALNNHVLLPCIAGIDVYAGKSWSFHKLPYPARPTLLPEPGNDSAIAIDNNSLWRFHNNSWTFLGSLATVVDSTAFLGSFDKRPGLWSSNSNNRIFFTPLPTPQQTAAKIPPDLLEHFTTGSAEQISAAAEALAGTGPLPIATLQSLLRTETSAPRIVALQKALAFLHANCLKSQLVVSIDGHRFQNVRFLAPLPNSALVLAAQRITHDSSPLDLTNALLYIDPQGRAHPSPAPEQLSLAKPTNTGITLTPTSQTQGWLAPLYGYSHPPLLIDFATGALLAQAPSVYFTSITTNPVTGQPFLSSTRSRYIQNPAPNSFGNILTTTSNPLEAVPQLRASPLPDTDNAYWVLPSRDGSLWQSPPLRSFDGIKWSPPLLKATELEVEALGSNSGLLLRSRLNYHFVDKNISRQNSTLENLILDNRTDFQQDFLPQKSAYSSRLTSIASDESKNIFLLHAGKLQVLIGDTWKNAALPLRAASMQHPVHLLRLNPNQFLLANSPPLPNTPVSTSLAIAQVRAGEILILPVPAQPDTGYPFLPLPIPDPLNNGIWIPWINSTIQSTSSALRITADGIAETLPNTSPLGVDSHHRLWLLQQPTLNQPTSFLLAHPRGSDPIRIPIATTSFYQQLLFDSHRNPWLQNLDILARPQPPLPAHAKLPWTLQPHFLTGLTGPITTITPSKHGFLIQTSYNNTRLHYLAPLPETAPPNAPP